MKRSNNIIILAAMLIIAAPGIASANSGTALALPGFITFVCCNFFIGIGEGYVLITRYGTKAFRSLFIMVVTNYLSAMVGIGFISAYQHKHPSMSGTWYSTLFFMVVLYALTIVVEWPFCHLILHSSSKPRKTHILIRSLKASVYLQTLSYLIVLPPCIVLDRFL